MKWKKFKPSLKFGAKKKHKRRIGPTKEESETFEGEEKEIRDMLRGRKL